MKTTIGNCRLKDFDAVLELLRQLWPGRTLIDDVMLKVYKKGLRSKNKLYLKAVQGKRIIGFCSLDLLNTLYGEGDLMHIDELVIHEDFRNQGVGRLMLDKVIQLSHEKGCRMIELETALHRLDAHRFYENLQFEKMGLVFSRKLY